MHYVGLDVHKKTISYCVEDVSGRIHLEVTIPATRMDLDRWMKVLPRPWTALFTGWIYDHLKPHAAALNVAHPRMVQAIAAAKGNDRIDAHKIADWLRCDFLVLTEFQSALGRERPISRSASNTPLLRSGDGRRLIIFSVLFVAVSTIVLLIFLPDRASQHITTWAEAGV